jgi:hypothetical protein
MASDPLEAHSPATGRKSGTIPTRRTMEDGHGQRSTRNRFPCDRAQARHDPYGRSPCYGGGCRSRGTRLVRRVPADHPAHHAVGLVGRTGLAGVAAVLRCVRCRQAPEARDHVARPAWQDLGRGRFHCLGRGQEPGPEDNLYVLFGELGHGAEPQPQAHDEKPDVSWHLPRHPHRREGLGGDFRPDRICRPYRQFQEHDRRRPDHRLGTASRRGRRPGEGPGRGQLEARPRPHLELVRRRLHDPLCFRQRAAGHHDPLACRRPARPADSEGAQRAHAGLPRHRGRRRWVSAQGRGAVSRAEAARLPAGAQEPDVGGFVGSRISAASLPRRRGA